MGISSQTPILQMACYGDTASDGEVPQEINSIESKPKNDGLVESLSYDSPEQTGIPDCPLESSQDSYAKTRSMVRTMAQMFENAARSPPTIVRGKGSCQDPTGSGSLRGTGEDLANKRSLGNIATGLAQKPPKSRLLRKRAQKGRKSTSEESIEPATSTGLDNNTQHLQKGPEHPHDPGTMRSEQGEGEQGYDQHP